MNHHDEATSTGSEEECASSGAGPVLSAFAATNQPRPLQRRRRTAAPFSSASVADAAALVQRCHLLVAELASLPVEALPVGPFSISTSRVRQLLASFADGRGLPVRRRGTGSDKGGKGPHGKPSSVFRGVNFHTRTGRWEAHLCHTAQVHLGCFDLEVHAALAYDLLSLKARGQTAVINFTAASYQAEAQRLEEIHIDDLVQQIRGSRKVLEARIKAIRLQAAAVTLPHQDAPPDPPPGPNAPPHPFLPLPPAPPTSLSDDYPSTLSKLHPSAAAPRRPPPLPLGYASFSSRTPHSAPPGPPPVKTAATPQLHAPTPHHDQPPPTPQLHAPTPHHDHPPPSPQPHPSQSSGHSLSAATAGPHFHPYAAPTHPPTSPRALQPPTLPESPTSPHDPTVSSAPRSITHSQSPPEPPCASSLPSALPPAQLNPYPSWEDTPLDMPPPHSYTPHTAPLQDAPHHPLNHPPQALLATQGISYHEAPPARHGPPNGPPHPPHSTLVRSQHPAPHHGASHSYYPTDPTTAQPPPNPHVPQYPPYHRPPSTQSAYPRLHQTSSFTPFPDPHPNPSCSCPHCIQALAPTPTAPPPAPHHPCGNPHCRTCPPPCAPPSHCPHCHPDDPPHPGSCPHTHPGQPTPPPLHYTSHPPPHHPPNPPLLQHPASQRHHATPPTTPPPSFATTYPPLPPSHPHQGAYPPSHPPPANPSHPHQGAYPPSHPPPTNPSYPHPADPHPPHHATCSCCQPTTYPPSHPSPPPPYWAHHQPPPSQPSHPYPPPTFTPTHPYGRPQLKRSRPNSVPPYHPTPCAQPPAATQASNPSHPPPPHTNNPPPPADHTRPLPQAAPPANGGWTAATGQPPSSWMGLLANELEASSDRATMLPHGPRLAPSAAAPPARNAWGPATHPPRTTGRAPAEAAPEAPAPAHRWPGNDPSRPLLERPPPGGEYRLPDCEAPGPRPPRTYHPNHHAPPTHPHASPPQAAAAHAPLSASLPPPNAADGSSDWGVHGFASRAGGAPPCPPVAPAPAPTQPAGAMHAACLTPEAAALQPGAFGGMPPPGMHAAWPCGTSQREPEAAALPPGAFGGMPAGAMDVDWLDCRAAIDEWVAGGGLPDAAMGWAAAQPRAEADWDMGGSVPDDTLMALL